MAKTSELIGIIGHFGIGHDLLNGQTVKTKIITEALKKKYGADEIVISDTHGGLKALLALPFKILKLLDRCKNVIILPSHKGLRLIAPMLSFFNLFYRRALHYCVIGGWLTDDLAGRPLLAHTLKKFTGIYAETLTMKKTLEAKGFTNVYVMPNCKDLKILNESELVYPDTEPYKLCTFSRVMKEKGIEDAIEAVRRINEKSGRTVYTLDIYGQVWKSQTEWFDALKKTFPDYVKYCGSVDFDKSVDVLKDYYALLFPTYYPGECFAGSLIDAMSAGLPIIASDWKYNQEIVNDNNGFLFRTGDIDDLIGKIEELKTRDLRRSSLREAYRYQPSVVISTLTDILTEK